MNTEKLFLIDPYNSEHLRLIDEFEKNNNIETGIKELLLNDIKDISKEEYDDYKKESNDIHTSLFIEESSKIKDICYIHGVKDRKSCTITFPPLNAKFKRRLIYISTDYALNSLGMEDAFISLPSIDKQLSTSLELMGYENLGEEQGKYLYLKEKETEKENQRKH